MLSSLFYFWISYKLFDQIFLLQIKKGGQSNIKAIRRLVELFYPPYLY